MSPISPISTAGLTVPTSSVSRSSAQEGASFKDFLLNSVNEVNKMQSGASGMVEHLFTGGDINPAEVLVAVQKADMAFRMLLQVRNKLLQAYDEVKNIRV